MNYKHYNEFKNTDIPWARNIPNHWKISKLKRIFKFEKGKNSNLLTEEYIKSNEGYFPVYSGQTKNKGIIGYINSYDYDFKNNVILVTTVGAKAMTTFLISGKLSLSQNCALIKLQSSKDLSDYYYYLCKILFNYERGLIPDIMQPSLRIGDLNVYNIIKPPLDEQQQIANYLDKKTSKIDTTIAKNKELINLLEEKRTALINQVVTKGLNPEVPMKDSGIGWIGEIPEHWEIKRLKYNCDVNPSTKKTVSDENLKINFLPMEKVSETGKYDNESIAPYSSISKGYTYFEDDDVLVAKITPCFENGKSTLLKNLKYGFGFGSTEFHVLRFKKHILPEFIYYLIKSYAFRTIGQAFMHGTAGQKRVGTDFIENYRMVTPPLSEQKEIINYLDNEINKLNNTIIKINESIKLLEEYKTSLIHHVVTGKIDVRCEN